MKETDGTLKQANIVDCKPLKDIGWCPVMKHQKTKEMDVGKEESKQARGLTDDEKLWGMLAHISALSGFLIPFGNILGPLAVYLIKGTESEFVIEHAKKALNFQITVSIAILVCIPLTFVLTGMVRMPVVALGALALGALTLGGLALVFTILAGVAANKGDVYKYPFAFNLVK